MTQPTNTYSRYTVSTNAKEDNLDKITMTTPYRTPLVSRASRSTATNTLHEWNRDDLRAPNKDNASIDGDTKTATAKTPPARLGNYCQIFREDITVSRRADRVRKFGMKKASQYFLTKAAKELQTDVEAMALSGNVAAAGSDSSAMKSAGIAGMVYTNTSIGAGAGTIITHSSGVQTTARVAGTTRKLTDGTWIQDVMQSASTKSSVVPDTCYMPPVYKKAAAGISGVAANRINQNRTKGKAMEAAVVMGVDIIDTGFGQLDLVPHYAMDSMNHILMINHDYVNIAYLDGLVTEKKGKASDGDSWLVLLDACVELLSEKSQAAVFDLKE